MTVPNRIVMTGHNLRHMPNTAVPVQACIDYYEARAKGGCGLIVASTYHPSPMTTAGPPAALQDDSSIPGFAKIPDLETIAHHDTLMRLLDRIDVEQIQQAQIALIRSLICKKKFQLKQLNRFGRA